MGCMGSVIRFVLTAYLLLNAPLALALPELTEDHFIILTGSPDRKEAERLLADLMARWPASVVLQSGYPQVMSSDGKKGLNPGFFIAVAGACANREDAMEVQKEIRKRIPGVYVRAVTRYLPGFIPKCPRLAVTPGKARKAPNVPKQYELAEEGPAGTVGLKWKLYTAKADCADDVLVHLLDKRGRLVDQRNEKAHCIQGDPHVDGSGESEFWHAYLASDKGHRTKYVMFTYEKWASDTGCNGGVALCPTADGIVEEQLEGMCSSSSYRPQEGETHCQK